MAQISDLVGLYGEIDRAVVGNAERRVPVSRLLPIYQHDDVHWYDQFVESTLEIREEESADPPFPSLEDALWSLGRIEPEDRMEGRMRARRLFAIAVAAQAFPEIRDPESELAALARAALPVRGSTEDAQGMLNLLTDEELLPSTEAPSSAELDRWWENLLTAASKQGLIDDPASWGPRPCTGSVVSVPHGGGVAAALESYFETDKLTFDQACRFLEPSNWTKCSPFWCEMDRLADDPPGVQQYHEQVSTSCKHKELAWTVTAELEFNFHRDPGVVAITRYRLSHRHPPGSYVEVDAGSLVVQEIGAPGAPRLGVRTTKRIRFRAPFSGTQLGMIMCAVGYAGIVEDLFFTCAIKGDPDAGTPFPEPEEGDRPAPGPAPAAVISELVDRAAALSKAYIDESARAVKASLEKIDDESYTADALVQDIAGVWVRTLRDGAAAVDIAARSARTAPRARPSDPQGD